MEKSTAVPSASPPRIVTLASVPFRVLLMSGQTTDAAEFLEAWSQTVPAQSFHPAEVSHFSFASPPNVLSALALLDSVRKGCFHAVIMMPPAASWSRLRHLADESQRPLRTRAFPLGLPELDAEAVSKTQCSNRQLEVTSWICEQAAQCKNRRVAILMTFPEDFAGHVSHGPASPWALEDFRSLQQHAGEVQRYAVYLCRFAGTEQRRAVGCWSNFRALQQEGYTGWPTHVRHAAQLQYTGPLPRSCPCVTQHMPMRGTASGQEFNSTQQQTLGVKFWLRALRDASPTEPIPLRDGISSQLVSVSASPLRSIAASAQSWSSLYRAWSSGSLTRGLLRDYSDPQTVERYLSGTVTSTCKVFSSESTLGSLGRDRQVDSTAVMTATDAATDAVSSPGFVAPPLVAPAGRSTGSSSLLCLPSPPTFLSSPRRSRSPRTRKAPLASLRPRGNVGCLGFASGPGIAVASDRGLVRHLWFLFFSLVVVLTFFV